MKLLYFIPALYNHGGMERVLTQKINYLAEYLGYEIDVITTEQKHQPCAFSLSGKVRLFHLDLNFNDHYDQSLIFKMINHYAKLRRYKKEIYKILETEKPDIVISLGGKEIDFLYKLKTNAGKVCEMHFSMNVRKQFLDSRKHGFVWKLIGTLRTNQLKKVTKTLDKLIVLTNQDKIQWESTHKNVLHIVNPNPFVTQSEKRTDSKTVISVGRLDAQKGYDLLIDAWKLVVEKHPDWKLNIFGTGELEHELRNKIRIFDMEDKIELKGLSKEIEKEYMASSFFVMSSLYEGLPMVLLEAMSCGLPVVSFDCEWGPREVIQNERNGFLVPAKDYIKLADQINILIENRQLRNEMSNEAVRTSKKYDIAKVMRQWDEMFKSLINTPKYGQIR